MMFKAIILSLLVTMNLQLSAMENDQKKVAKTDEQKKHEELQPEKVRYEWLESSSAYVPEVNRYVDSNSFQYQLYLINKVQFVREEHQGIHESRK